jgi:hypothetical protein
MKIVQSYHCGNLKLRYGKLRQFSRKQYLLCQHRLSGLMSKGWAPRAKGSHLIDPCKQVTEAKSKAQHTYGCMWLHWLFHFPSVLWPSWFNSLSFISLLCHPFPLSHQNTACLFLFWTSPCYTMNKKKKIENRRNSEASRVSQHIMDVIWSPRRSDNSHELKKQLTN